MTAHAKRTSVSIRRWIGNRSMRTKLIAGITFVSSMVLVVSLLVSSIFEAVHFRDRIADSYQTTAKLIAINLEVAVLFEDDVDAGAILSSLATYPSINYACVQLMDGRHLAHYSREALKDHGPLEPVASVVIDHMDLYVVEPIVSNGNTIAALCIQGRLDAFAKYLIFKVGLVIVILVLSSVFTVFLAAWLGDRATRPILKLAETARKISSERDFSLRQKVTSTDEVGLLIRSFNRMMDDIESQNQIIQASERRFRSYFELGIVGMALLDSKLEFRESNERLRQIFGCDSITVCDGNLLSRIREESTGVKEALLEVASGKREQFAGECWLHASDDQPIFAMISMRRIHEQAEAHQPNVIVLVQDITERKRYEDALLAEKERAESSNRAKDEFLSIISHELRTPLNPIIGYTELLELEAEKTEQQTQLGYIKQSANHLLDIINTILDYTRFDRGLKDVSFSSIHYKTLCEECVALLERSIGDKELSFRLEHEVDLQPDDEQALDLVETDKTKLRQVILNLLSNAVKFTDRGEILLITKLQVISKNRATLQVQVKDTGIGIEAHKLQEIFEPFQQGDVSLTRKYEGLGLGLAVCKKIISLLGGEIGCASELGKGSCFTFKIPVTHSTHGFDDGQVDPLGVIMDAEVAPKHRQRILVIDDDFLNRKIASSMLHRLGYQVDLAEDGEHGIAMAASRAYKAILMDIQMPRINGYDASIKIKQQMREKHTPIIAVTAHVVDFENSPGPRSGMDGYIGKPYSFKQLQDVLAEFCENG